MVRAFTRSIFGRNAGRSFCSMRMVRTPRRPRSMASVSPVGPAPTIRTSQSMVFHPARGESRGASAAAIRCGLRAASSHAVREERFLFSRLFSLKLLERLIGRIGALRGRGIEILGDLATEIKRHFVLALAMAVELDTHDVVLAIAYGLEHRLRNERAAKIRRIVQR